MLDQAADRIQARQSSKKRPRTYADYRKMLAERDLDIVLIATPDHWHALPMIEAVKAGCDVYQQKPISADVIEGAAMLAAARKYGRVVQVGLQRRSTPHLVEARDQIIREGKLGKIGLVEIYCYYPMRLNGMPPNIPPPEYLDWDAWTGPAPLRPYNAFIHPGPVSYTHLDVYKRQRWKWYRCATSTSTCSTRRRTSSKRARVRRSVRALTPITARCWRSGTSISCSLRRPTTGMHCRCLLYTSRCV